MFRCWENQNWVKGLDTSMEVLHHKLWETFLKINMNLKKLEKRLRANIDLELTDRLYISFLSNV